LITREGQRTSQRSYGGDGGNLATQRHALVFDGADGLARLARARFRIFVRTTSFSSAQREFENLSVVGRWTTISRPTTKFNSPSLRLHKHPLATLEPGQLLHFPHAIDPNAQSRSEFLL